MERFNPNLPKFDSFTNIMNQYTTRCKKKEIDCKEFVKVVNFELIDSLKNKGTKDLVFDNSCKAMCSSKKFVHLARIH